MKEILLDGSRTEGVEAVHKLFGKELALPEYYGFTLDALYDVLTEQAEDVKIVIRNAPRLVLSLGEHYGRLMRMLEDAADENKHILLLT